jgi:hypothetical protein
MTTINKTHTHIHIRELIRTLSVRCVVFILLCTLLLLSEIDVSPTFAAPVSIAKTTQSDWQAGRYEFSQINTVLNPGDITLPKDLGQWDASGPADANEYMYTSNPMVKVGRFVYMNRNRATGQFLRYDLDSREWKEMAFVPNGVYEIADLTTDGVSSIYAIATRYTASYPTLTFKHFLKYDIPSNSWSYLADTPDFLRTSASIEYVAGSPNYIYAVQGSGTWGFWRYNVDTNVWSVVNNTTVHCQGNCDIIYDGSLFLYWATDWNNPDSLYRYNTQLGTWTRMANAPGDQVFFTGHRMTLFGDYIYFLRGANTKLHYRYSILTNTWSQAADLPFISYYQTPLAIPEDNKIMIYAGITNFIDYYPATNTYSDPLGVPTYGQDSNAQMVADQDGNIWYCAGAGQNVCYKYVIATNTWTATSAAPNTMGTTPVAWSGTRLYADRGNYENRFYEYNPTTNTWSTKTSPTYNIGDGGAMVADADYVYASPGGGQAYFMRYNISANTWSLLTASPEGVYRGSQLIKHGNNIYLLQGYGRGGLFRYDITGNSWVRLKSVPVGVNIGGGMAFDGVDTFYTLVGGMSDYYSRMFYKYSISTDTWSRIADTPEIMRSGGSLVWANNSVYAIQGEYSYAMWRYIPATDPTAYRQSGQWFSPVYDLGYVSSWTSFTANQTTPAGTNIQYYSRSSPNSNSWSPWAAISGGTISSPAYRYMQIRAVLGSDGTNTPSISDFSISYNSDTTAPNVSGLVIRGYSERGGDTLVNGTPAGYPNTNPYFEWDAALDAWGNAVEGYYVYFGTNPTADPVASGALQIHTYYTAAMSMTKGQTYYLRVKAKDNQGNLSAALTNFEYIYDGISPPTSQVLTTQGDVEQGTLTNVVVPTATWWNTNYANRKQITVTNNSGSSLLKEDRAVVVIDTADLIDTSKLQEDGDDFRIVYWNGSAWVESARGWESFDSANTSVYFDVQAPIANGAIDNNYYMYYGHSVASSPPALTVMRDDYEDNSIDSTKWTVNSGFGTVTETSGQMRYTGRLLAQSGVSTQFRSNTAVSGDFTFETRIHIVNNNGGNFNAGIFLGSYDDTTVNNAAGVLIGFHNNGNMYFYHKNSGAGYTDLGLTRTYTKGQWYTIKVVRKGTGWTFFRDGQPVGGSGGALYAGDVYFNSLRYWKESLTTSYQGDVYYDDTSFNAHIKTGVSSALGSETAKNDTALATLQLKPEALGTWAGYQMPSLPREARFYYGASVYADDKLYVLRGNNVRTFYSLNIETGQWSALPDAPQNIASNGGSVMVFDGDDDIYVTRGSNTAEFYRYTISTQTWTTSLSSAPLNFNYGATGVKVGTTIYYLRGNATTDFMAYSISEDTWNARSSFPYAVSTGSGIVHDGGDYIYGFNGGNSIGFARYSISANSWDYLTHPQAPYLIGGGAVNNMVLDAANNELYLFTHIDMASREEQRHFIWKYSITTKRWSPVDADTDFAPLVGSVAYDGDRYVYLIQGYNTSDGGTRSLYRYDLRTGQFFPETPPITHQRDFVGDLGTYVYFAPYTGASMVFDGDDTVYLSPGNGSSQMVKYTVSTKLWDRIAPIPCAYTGGGMQWVGNSMYAVCGSNTQLFFRYDPAEGDWERLADTLATVQAAGNQGLVAVGANTLYLLRGNGSTTLYKYTILTNEWTTESSLIPGTIGNSWGASVTYDGSDNLYIIRGNNTSWFYRYQLSTQQWYTLRSIPALSFYAGGSLYQDGKIYAFAGDNTYGFYVYDVASDLWSTGPRTPSQIGPGTAIVKGPGNTAYATAGYYDMAFWKFNLPSANSSFTHTGTFTSKVFDLENPYAWAGLQATVASPEASMVQMYTRTSTDQLIWSEWEEATELKQIESDQYHYNIRSGVNRYAQIKAVLSSQESASTPEISDIALHYYADPDPPTNPTVVAGYTNSSKLEEIVDNEWGNVTSPYFEWSGADDAEGSGIQGYYVYFGTDANADPVIDGDLITTSHFTPNLTADGEYYLAIQSVDNADNVSLVVWRPFHYRLDLTKPQELSSVAADPRTYTSVDDYTMFWLPVQDVQAHATSSGLLGYEYKTATASGALSQNQLITQTQISGITKYQVGANTFYVRSVDIAGNTSEYATVSYYYSGNAPTKPQNLIASPTYSTSNSFSFSWDEPTSFQGSIKEYRYSVNAPLTATNYHVTNTRTLTAGSYATIKGENKLYLVAVDEADNVLYEPENVAVVTFTADTSAPGIPINPEAFDNSIRATKQYKVGLTWDPPEDMGTGFAGYAIYGSASASTCQEDFSAYSLAGTTAGTTYVVTTLNAIPLESKTYNFCLKAYDSTNQYSAVSSTISLWPTGRWLTAPTLTEGPTATVKTKSATITWSTSREANSFVQYGTKSGEYGNEVGSSLQEIAHSIKLTNLSPSTTYYYKAIWADEDGNQGFSDEQTFITNAAPTVSNVKFSEIGLTSVYVSFFINNATNATIEYGITTDYGDQKAISTSTDESTQSVRLENLVEGTLYHLRIVAEDEENNTFTGDDYTFETLPIPKVTDLRVQQVLGMPSATLRLIWQTNAPTTTVVTYYPTSAASAVRDEINLSLVKSHEVILRSLLDETGYTLMVTGKDVAGNAAESIIKTLKTATDIRPPEVFNLAVDSTIGGVGESARAQLNISWDTDEPASTQVEYGEGTGGVYRATTQEDSNRTTNHMVTIPGLKPGTIYHFRVISKDKAGNIGYSEDTVIITPRATKDALNLVIQSLGRTFSFLNNVKINR